MKVIFYQTVATGQEVEAVITYDGKKYACEGNKVILELLPPESAGSKVIFAALEKAPAKFDGRYLRAELVTDAKGSSESGHYGHTGLPGVWGGSRPTGRAEPDAEPQEDRARDPSSAAKDVRGAAEKLEPEITETVTGIAEELDGEMFQLDKRIKSLPSIERRLKVVMERDDLTLDEAVEGFADAVRYTIVLEDDTYVDGALSALKTLEGQGWTEHDALFENYWESDIGFEGYCCGFIKGDMKFELQFHTPRGAKILPESHLIYERTRKMKDGPEKFKLIKKMKALWDTVPAPPGWERLLGALINR